VNRRLTVALAMRPEVAPLALVEALSVRLQAIADVQPDIITDFGSPAARDRLESVDVLLTSWGCPKIDGDVLDAAPRLRAVIHAAGSVKHHLTPEVWRRGVLVSSAASVNAYPVAQYTASVILLAGKRAFRLARDYSQGRYKNHLVTDTGNHERTVGVVGASRTGRLVLQMLAPHGFRLLVSDPTLDPAGAADLEPHGQVELVELDELLRRCDVVTLHAPALPETHHLIDDRRLGLMRDGAVLVNTARGGIVDTDALTRHCATARIDAVLDVTDPEPLPPDHPLLSLPNVLVTPHVAGAMGTEVRRLGEFAVSEIERLAAGRSLLGRVRADQLSLLA